MTNQLDNDQNQDLYVEPRIIQYCYKEISQPGCLLRLKAPKKMGKTALMSKIAKYAANDKKHRIAILNLRDATEQDFNDLNKFLTWFCSNVTISVNKDISSRNPVEKHWNNSIGNDKNKCKTYFETNLLPGDMPLTLAIDYLDRVYRHQEVAGDFLGMLRTWHDDASAFPIWGNLRLVLAYTQEYREINNNYSPYFCARFRGIK